MAKYFWEPYSDEKLLKLRFCDLKLKLVDTPIQKRVEKLYGELEKKGLKFKPHFWLSNDWFTPDGISGIAIPFYVAHPRLARLERKNVYEVEGGNEAWFMKLLRHECGHAIENAYGLRRRRKRQEIFGKSSEPYSPYYTPKPYSKKFVLHLDDWYSQSHPDDDFAETFAVWLTPRSNWRKRYRGWGALKKLEYIDELMQELSGKKPPYLDRSKMDTLVQLKDTLGNFYRRKRSYLGLDHPDYYSKQLNRIFSNDPSVTEHMSAASFLNSIRKDVRKVVSVWTGIYQYTIDQVINDMINEVRKKNMRLVDSPEESKKNFISLLTVTAMNFIHDENHRLPR